jgi:dihydropteroate synthase
VYTVLVENITPREAMILKQELLSLGGDCAVPKESILNNLVFIDAILIGNSIQLRLLVKKLRNQVFNLTKLAEKLESNLSDLEIAND